MGSKSNCLLKMFYNSFLYVANRTLASSDRGYQIDFRCVYTSLSWPSFPFVNTYYDWTAQGKMALYFTRKSCSDNICMQQHHAFSQNSSLKGSLEGRDNILIISFSFTEHPVALAAP